MMLAGHGCYHNNCLVMKSTGRSTVRHPRKEEAIVKEYGRLKKTLN